MKRTLKVPPEQRLMSGRLWTGAQRAPVQVQKQMGGKKPIIDKVLLAEQVGKFLKQHSKGTSRFCHTKPRHRKARLEAGRLGMGSAKSFQFGWPSRTIPTTIPKRYPHGQV